MSLLSLQSSSELIDKLRTEITVLQDCDTFPEYDYLAFNIILSLNHIFEWFLKDKTKCENTKKQCVLKFNPFISPYDVSADFKGIYKSLDAFPEVDCYQETVRKLCNKAKHFKKTVIEKQSKNYTAVSGGAGMYCGSPSACCGAFDRYTYSVKINNNEVDLESLLSEQIEKWSLFVEGV